MAAKRPLKPSALPKQRKRSIFMREKNQADYLVERVGSGESRIERLLANRIGANRLKAFGYSAKELVGHYRFTGVQLAMLGFSAKEIASAGFSKRGLRALGFSDRQIEQAFRKEKE